MPKPLPAFEDWKAPWENSEEDFDADRAKRFIYDLMNEKVRHQNLRDRQKATIAELREEIDAGEGLSSKKERGEDTSKDRASSDAAGQDRDSSDLAHENDLLKVRLETGLSEKAARRLVGDTYDELLADAKDYMQEHGIATSDDGEAGDGEDQGDEGSQPPSESVNLRRAPRRAATKTGLGDNQDAEKPPVPSDYGELFV